MIAGSKQKLLAGVLGMSLAIAPVAPALAQSRDCILGVPALAWRWARAGARALALGCETIETINVAKPSKPSRLRNHRNHPLTWALEAGGNRLAVTGGTGGSGCCCRVFKKTNKNPSR